MSEVKACMLGAAILAAATAAWLLYIELERFSWAVATVLWMSPAAAGFIASFLSPTHKVILGSSMALVAALFAGILNWCLQLPGTEVDFPGLEGGITLLLLVLVGTVPLSAIGAIAGKLVSRQGL